MTSYPALEFMINQTFQQEKFTVTIKLLREVFYQRIEQLQSAGHQDKKRPNWANWGKKDASKPWSLYITSHTFELADFLYLEKHGAVLLCVRWLNVIRRARVSPARGAHDDGFPRFPLETPRHAAAACAELVRLIKSRILQDALREGSPQAALTGTARQTFTWNIAQKVTYLWHYTTEHWLGNLNYSVWSLSSFSKINFKSIQKRHKCRFNFPSYKCSWSYKAITIVSTLGAGFDLSPSKTKIDAADISSHMRV